MGRQRIQRLSYVACEFDIRPVAVVKIRWGDVDVDDPAISVRIPFGWPIFHRIVTNRDDQIGGVKEKIGRLVGQLTHTAAEVLKR